MLGGLGSQVAIGIMRLRVWQSSEGGVAVMGLFLGEIV